MKFLRWGYARRYGTPAAEAGVKEFSIKPSGSSQAFSRNETNRQKQGDQPAKQRTAKDY
jgi:hypothetical protein